tara:strand:- start:669 stop:1214 length:546 start_codon:yes stop_codon:yes gene_type:complete
MQETRNIIDYFAYWNVEAIKADLDKRRHNFSVLISNLYSDFNIGSVIRNANAFLAKEVIIYGKRKYDRRGTVGTYKYENLKFVKTSDDLEALSGSTIVGVDNLDNAVPIESFDWPEDKHVVMAFGQEQIGLPEEIIDICDHIVYITQYGSVRSLNVGCASAIAMYDYCRRVESCLKKGLSK